MDPRITILSPCRTYRYTLWREWLGGEGYALFIGLNPSTADEVEDDRTIRRCISFAQRWGYGALCMTNLFAFRTVSPEIMKAASDPVGPENNAHLVAAAAGASVVVAAWGVDGAFKGRDREVRALLPRLHYLQLTKDGHPSHPLYLPASLRPLEWTHQ